MKKYKKKIKPQKNNCYEEEEKREDDDTGQQEDEIEEGHEFYDEQGAEETDNININKFEEVNDYDDKNNEQNERNSLDLSSSETNENIRRLFSVDEDEIQRLKYLDERLGDHWHRCT